MTRNNAPVNVILDTDIWGDIDDMLALAMLHALHDRGEINLCAVTISTEDLWCASYVDLVNTFYRHPAIPVGIVCQGITVEQTLRRCAFWKFQEVTYTRWIAQRRNGDGSLVYPRRLKDGADVPEAVGLLRQVLAAQPDCSVVMIQIGYSTNLARLLGSPADDVSSLTGAELIARKVRLLSVMAGTYGTFSHMGLSVPNGAPEFNLFMDAPSARKLFGQWPTRVVASGGEIARMKFPARCIEQDFNYVPNHPIAESYRYWTLEGTQTQNGQVRSFALGWPHDHHTADLTAVLHAARPDHGYFSISRPGKITVLADGASRFEEIEGGMHHHLILDPQQENRVLEAMTMLVSQPPAAQYR